MNYSMLALAGACRTTSYVVILHACKEKPLQVCSMTPRQQTWNVVADAVGMWSIPAQQRPLGQAYLVVAMHALGDVPSPPIVGALQGKLSNLVSSSQAIEG